MRASVLEQIAMHRSIHDPRSTIHDPRSTIHYPATAAVRAATASAMAPATVSSVTGLER